VPSDFKSELEAAPIKYPNYSFLHISALIGRAESLQYDNRTSIEMVLRAGPLDRQKSISHIEDIGKEFQAHLGVAAEHV
jgi:hypothetical protein